MRRKQRSWLIVALLSLAAFSLAACGPTTPGSSADSDTPSPATAPLSPRAPTQPPATPTFTPAPTQPSAPSPQAIQIQADPPQAELGKSITVQVTGLPAGVLAGEQTACVNLEDARGQAREGPLPLSLDDRGFAGARLALSDQLEPGGYRLSVVICGWTDAADAPQPPAEPEALGSVPFTVTPPSGQFDRVQRVPSPDGRWTAILNETAGSLDLRRETDGRIVPIFPVGSTARAVAWSPDSRRLLAVRANWQAGGPGREIQISGPIEIWSIELADDQAGRPARLFQSPGQEPWPEQILFGDWSPDSRSVIFWLGMSSASIQADGMSMYVLDSRTGQVTPTGEVTLLNAAYQSWAPDSSALAFTAGGYRSAQVNKWLDVFDLASGQVTTIISDTEQIPGIVAWSPRGDVIAYAALPAAETGSDLADWMSFENPAIAARRVYLLDPATGEHRRLNDAGDFQDAPAWSGDGETLYYVQREGETMVLMAADPATGRAEPVEASRRPAPRAVGYYGQSDWDDLLAYRPGAPRAAVPSLSETYADPDGLFTLRYPAGWQVSDGWQSILGWRPMPTLSPYPPDAAPDDIGPFSGEALIAIETVQAREGVIEALLEKALSSPGPGQIVGRDGSLIAFDRRELSIDGRPALRLETIGDFGVVNHVLLVLDGSRALVLRGQGDGRLFDAIQESLQFSSESKATATGQVILGAGNHQPVDGLPLWIGTESQGEPDARTDARGAFTLTGLPLGLVDVVDSHLAFQVPVTSPNSTIDLGLLKYPLFHPPPYYWWTAAPLPDPHALLESGRPVEFSVCLVEPGWERPSEGRQEQVVWSRRPFSDASPAWLRWWFQQPAVIYNSIDQFSQSFPGGPNLDPLAADWCYLLGLWTTEDLVARSACAYDGPSLEDLLARRQVEVWLLGYQAIQLQRLDKQTVEYEPSALCDPAARNCVERPGYHFALHVTPAAGYQVIRFPGEEDVLAVHLIEDGRELLQVPHIPPSQYSSDQPPFYMESARQALLAFFSLLHDGRYAEAVAYYGGSYSVLRDWNPLVAPDDYAALLRNACTSNGLRCLPIKRIVLEKALSAKEYRFAVEFMEDDGSLFVRGPCCGASEADTPAQWRFPYSVKKVGNAFMVQELPAYVP
jgi:Tol biopolymer transport system component